MLPIILGFAIVAIVVAASRQAARRKGRTLAWGFAAIVFPPSLLVLEMLSTVSDETKQSNMVLEWVGSIVALIVLVAYIEKPFMMYGFLAPSASTCARAIHDQPANMAFQTVFQN